MLLDAETFGFSMPWAWVSLDLEVLLGGSLFFNEPSVAAVVAFLDAGSGREPEAAALLLPVVHCCFLLPKSICVPVKNIKNNPKICNMGTSFFSSPLFLIIFISCETAFSHIF